ncbi:hypothetical protein [Nocardia nova]|uniref:hypothetical protein n=1 Tax=Nocardia nova TaxID=37330 RepID=UPI000B1D43A5|nr:hypothetical protein [Nocardia nova]
MEIWAHGLSSLGLRWTLATVPVCFFAPGSPGSAGPPSMSLHHSMRSPTANTSPIPRLSHPILAAGAGDQLDRCPSRREPGSRLKSRADLSGGDRIGYVALPGHAAR